MRSVVSRLHPVDVVRHRLASDVLVPTRNFPDTFVKLVNRCFLATDDSTFQLRPKGLSDCREVR